MQFDLFLDPPPETPPSETRKVASDVDRKPLEEMSDDDIIAALPRSNLATAEALGEAVITRGLGARAVPGLEHLWRRFTGIAGPLPEHRAALLTLGRVGTPEAKAILAKILRTNPPDALLPLILTAAGEARVAPTATRLAAWMTHGAPGIRAAAFALARLGGATPDQLRTGLADSCARVRRAAMMTMGLVGYSEVKPGLLVELGCNPTGEVVKALASIMDDDVITHLGRCANAHPALRALILEELRDSDSPRAASAINSIACPNA